MSSFVLFKTKIAPRRPRLFLVWSYREGVRFATKLSDEHDLKIDSTFFWFASKTALLWLPSD